MGLISNLITEVTTNVIEDAADNIVVGAVAGAVGAATGIVKGAKAVGKAAVSAKNTVGNAVNNARDAVGDAVDGAKEVTEKVLTVTIGDKDARHYRKEKRYLAKNPDCSYLIIQRAEEAQETFCVYDPDENIRYYVQGKLSERGVQLTLLNSEQKTVGKVKKAPLALRAPIFHETKPANYVIEIMGQQVAILKTKLATNNESYEIDPFGWRIKGSVFKWDFSVFDGDDEIVHISKRKGYDSPTYILDFPQEDHEMVGLLIVLTLICRED